MKDKFALGIEISEDVVETSSPSKIKRYDQVEPKKEVKVDEKEEKTLSYRYRPGINTTIMQDIDV